MTKRPRRRWSTLLVVVIAAAVGLAGYAFTAANTFPSGAPNAGDGSEPISGYAVTAISYTLNGANPRLIDAVNFDLDDTANTVLAAVTAGGTLYPCSLVSGMSWTCATTAPVQTTVALADELTVLAVSR